MNERLFTTSALLVSTLSCALSLAAQCPCSTDKDSTYADSIRPCAITDYARSDSLDSTPRDSLAPHERPYYTRHTRRVKHLWSRLTPNQSSLQFAGSIGIMNFGLGWHYARRDCLETELLVGWVPRYHSEKTKVTFTLKQRYIPWHCPLSSRWIVEPLTTGLFFNTIFGEGFWASEPDKYPKRYYGFSTKIRAHVFLGQRLRYNIPSRHRVWNKSISAYYELSTCDLYIASAVTNRNITLKDILSLALGIRFEMF